MNCELHSPRSKPPPSSLRGKEVGWDSPARMELVAAIDDEADHLNMLVGNLLDMSRDRIRCTATETGMEYPGRDRGNRARTYAASGGRTHLEVDVPEDLPLIPVDYVQMEQVFTNLVSNSLKYAPANTVVCIRAQGGR